MRYLTIPIFLCLANASAAQSVLAEVESDLDGSGGAERFTLLDTGNGSADLQIDDTARGTVFAADIAWVGGMAGQQPELAVAENGSVLLTSMNEAVGRNRWRQTLTIAYRRGDYVIAGVSYSFYDTLDPEAGGLCDFNLLNGRGEVDVQGGKQGAVAAPFARMPVTAWKMDREMPTYCYGS